MARRAGGGSRSSSRSSRSSSRSSSYSRGGYRHHGPSISINGHSIQLKGIPGLIVLIITCLVFLGFFGVFFIAIAGDLLFGGTVRYDDDKMEEYLETTYIDEFGTSAESEDNILFVFLYDDEIYYNYDYSFYVGDDISTDLFHYIDSFSSSIVDRHFEVDNYEEEIEANLCRDINDMSNELRFLGNDNLICDHVHDGYNIELNNKSSYELDKSNIEASLSNFSNTTGVSITLVLDTRENVFGKSVEVDIFALLVLGFIFSVFIIIIVLGIVKSVKSIKKKNDNTSDIEEKNPGIKPIPGMENHGSNDEDKFNIDNDDFNINLNDFK